MQIKLYWMSPLVDKLRTALIFIQQLQLMSSMLFPLCKVILCARLDPLLGLFWPPVRMFDPPLFGAIVEVKLFSLLAL